MELPNIYMWDRRMLMAVPIILILLSLVFIPNIQMGIDFKGGTLITLHLTKDVDSDYVKQAFTEQGFPPRKVVVSDTTIGKMAEVQLESDDKITNSTALHSQFSSLYYDVAKDYSYLLAFNTSGANVTQDIIDQYQTEYTQKRAQMDEKANALFALMGAEQNASSYTDIIQLRKDADSAFKYIKTEYQNRMNTVLSEKVPYDSISVDVVSPTLATHFIEKAMFAMGLSLLFALMLAFVVFRNPVSALIVMSGALADVVISLGGMGLFGVQLTVASFAALLTIMGLSLDTDMLLSMRVVKIQEGTPSERAYGALKTGATMSVTGFAAFIMLFSLGLFASIPTYYEIGAVISMGLVGDLIATWCFNAVLVLWFVESQRKKSYGA